PRIDAGALLDLGDDDGEVGVGGVDEGDAQQRVGRAGQGPDELDPEDVPGEVARAGCHRHVGDAGRGEERVVGGVERGLDGAGGGVGAEDGGAHVGRGGAGAGDEQLEHAAGAGVVDRDLLDLVGRQAGVADVPDRAGVGGGDRRDVVGVLG